MSKRSFTPILYLQAVNGTRIPVYKLGSLMLKLGLRGALRCVFMVASATCAAIGAGVLTNHSLLVDVNEQRLLDATTFLSVRGIAAPVTAAVARSMAVVTDGPFAALLREFPNLTWPPLLKKSLKNDVRHNISTKGHALFLLTSLLNSTSAY